jgi:hypothetical protein
VRHKNDAMQQRHWQKPMDVTGVKFDVSSSNGTLGNIFPMRLHLDRFTGDFEDIVKEAVQELKIENELKRIEKMWRIRLLQLAKYTGKNRQGRGFVLRAGRRDQAGAGGHHAEHAEPGGRQSRIYLSPSFKLVSECLDACVPGAAQVDVPREHLHQHQGH